MRTLIHSRHVVMALLLLIGVARGADAQCAGDCNTDGAVAINELIVGVNIALGAAEVSACASFDTNGDGTVVINELIAAVNNALNGCSEITPTQTATPTPVVTPIPTSEVCARPSTACGDGIPDVLSKTETCDDGNTSDDDGCPSNCCVRACSLMQTRPLRVNVNFAANDPNVFLTSLHLSIRYPDGVIDVPGIGDNPAVIDAVSSDIFAVTPRDFNFRLDLLLEDPSFLGYSDGTAATITFGVCDQAAQAPAISSITCKVFDGGDADFNVIPGDEITCTLTPAP